MRIYILAGVHGDEPFSLRIVDKLRAANNPDIKIRIGNPKALAKGERFLENDLNRSFNGHEHGLEASIAKDIKREMTEFKPDLVIDMHTSRSDIKRVAIVAVHNDFTESICRQLDMGAIVMMTKDLTEASAMSCFPDKTVSLEFGIAQHSEALAAEIAAEILALKTEPDSETIKLPQFEVIGEIGKDFEGLKGIKNLVYNEALDGYPFLAGPDTYETIGGFLTRKLD